MTIPVAPLSASADDGVLAPVLLQFANDANPAPPTAATAGQTVTFTFTVNCSSLDTDCVNARVTDTIPAPLILQSVSGVGSTVPTSLSKSGNSFTLTFQEALDSEYTGLQAGRIVSFSATTTVPTDLDADWDGVTITNPAQALVDNDDSNQSDDSQVLLSAPLVKSASATYSVSPSTTSAIVGRAITITATGKNTSNGSVDELDLQLPQNPGSDVFDAAEIESMDVTAPTGGDLVEVDWYDGTIWHTGTPAATAALPDGVDPADIHGLRFRFTSTSGGIAAGSVASVVIHGKLRSSVASLSSTAVYPDTLAAWVSKAGVLSSPATASGSLTLTPAAIDPVLQVTLTPNDLVGGLSTEGVITARNGGDFSLNWMTITEPVGGTFADLGVAFSAWRQNDVEWPVNAEQLSIEYLYDGDSDYSTALVTTTRDTIPEPDAGRTVLGFRATFTNLSGAAIGANEYAVMPFDAATIAVTNDVTTTDTAHLDVETTDGADAGTDASASLTRRTARVNAQLGKQFNPDSVYGVPGATTLVSLPGGISPLPTSPTDTGGSTVGATKFVISDPESPSATPSAFWNMFDLTTISATEVPANAVLDIEYWSGTQWLPLSGATGLTGPQFFTRALTSEERDAVQGIRFVYTPTSGLLPPGFTGQPNLKVVLRSELRDGSGTVADAIGETDQQVDNAAGSSVENAAATPPTATADATTAVTVIAVPGGADGGGLPLVAKAWQDVPANGAVAVKSRSGEEAVARLSWGTGGVGFSTVTVADPAQDPSSTAVSSTAFDAFDLVGIEAISSADDPLLKYDEIQQIQVFIPGTGWVEAQNDPCPAACDGTFSAFTLSDFDRANATGVRLIVAESPTRAARLGTDPTAPSVGSGVAAIAAENRQIDLVFAVRDTRRSDGSAVLGSTRGTLYNSAQPGVVVNSARVQGSDADNTVEATGTSTSSILILDTPINVAGSKQWLDGPLGTPPAGTPADFYPSGRLVLGAQNTSASRVDTLEIVDPVEGRTPFDEVDLAAIGSITVPDGATSTTVTIDWAGGGSTDYTSVTAALALTSTDLADAVGITVRFDGRITSGASGGVTLYTRLRATIRGTSDPVDGDSSPIIQNTASAIAIDAGGTQTPPDGESVNTVSAEYSAEMDVQTLNYGVTATKKITAATTSSNLTPAIQYDGDSPSATVTITGQPTGNVRTTQMAFEDSTPGFWNAYALSTVGSGALASPIDRVQVDVLVGVDYTVNPDNTISETCGGSSDLTACWVLGTPKTSYQLPTMPPGATMADIRGVRYTFTRADGAVWERPYNPTQTTSFTVTRRTNLVAPADTPVPSTLFIYTTPAPDESATGLFDDSVEVTAMAVASGSGELWSAQASASAQIQYQHRPARVSVVKAPFGALTLGAPIPYTIDVTNTGSGQDKPLGDVVVTDVLPVDGSGPILVMPTDPDTGLAETPAQAFSYTMFNGAGVQQATPTVTATLGAATPTGQTLTFALTGTIPLGWKLEISAPLMFRDYLIAGTIAQNVATVTADQPFDDCTSTTDVTTINATIHDVESCTSSTRAWPLPSAPMTIIKGVRGVGAGPLDADGDPAIDPGTSEPYDDLGVLKTVTTSPTDCSTGSILVDSELYYRYPCVPITRPGGTEEWAAQFTNSGNIPVKQVEAIDVLPTANDQGVIIASSRGSKWTPTLTTYPQVNDLPSGATYTVYYVDQPGIATPRCNGADIQNDMGMSPTSDPPMVTSYWDCLDDTSAADDIPSREAAWKVLSPTASPATLASVVALKFDVEIPGAGLLPGAAVSITYESKTAAVPQIAETDANLDRDSIAYNSIAGAAVGVDGSDDLPYRFVAEPRKVGVALATGSVAISKAVTGSAAPYAPSTFDIGLSCTSDNQSISLLHSDGTARSPFTVAGDGSTLVIEGVPLYAKCDVAEAQSYGATQTTVTPSQVTAQAANTTNYLVYNPHPAFGSRPAIELSTITNRYASASFTVSKTIDNGGALDQNGNAIVYQSPQFTATCTYSNGVSSVNVLTSGTFTLASGASRTFTGLPAGSSCTVTETNRRSAATTTSVVTTNGVAATAGGSASTFTLAEDGVAGAVENAVAFTNTYRVGSFTVNKAVTGAGAAYGTGTFTLHVVCTLSAATPTTVWQGDLTYSTATTLTRTIDNLAAGASCVVTETAAAGATNTMGTGTTTITAGSTVTRTVTNRFDLASLTVSKTVDTNAVDEDGHKVVPAGTFDMSVACTFQGSTVLPTGYSTSPVTFSLTDGTSKTLTGLPAGASCAVTETTTQDADATDVQTTSNGLTVSTAGTSATIASLSSDTAGGAATNSALVTNSYGVASFTITKALLGGGAAQFGAASATAHLSCTAPSGESSYDGDVVVPGGGSVRIDHIVEGSTCDVSEVDPAGSGADAWQIVDDDDNVITGTGIVVTAADPGRVTLRNWYLTGSVTVTKQLVGAGAAKYGIGPFEFTLACTRGGVPVTIPGGDTRSVTPAVPTAVYTGIASGAHCALSETDAAGATSSRILTEGGAELSTDAATGIEFDVTVDPTNLATDTVQPGYTIENDFELAPITITKDVLSAAVDQDGTSIDYGSFPIALDCTFQGYEVYADGYDALTPMQTTLADGGSWSLTGLPAGASCEATETDSRGAVVSTVVTAGGPAASATGPIADLTLVAAGNTVAYTNAYPVGSIQLSKLVSGDGATAWGTSQFQIDVTCTFAPGGIGTVWTKQYSFHAGDAPVTLADLPTGASCAVEETATGGANSTTIHVDAVDTSGIAATATVGDGTTTDVVVENEFDLAEVDVVKTIAGAGASAYGAGPFQVSLTCTRDIDGTTTPVDIPDGATRDLTVGNGYQASYQGLPSGASCHIDETKTGGANLTTYSSQDVTLVDAATEIDITNEFHTTGLTVDNEVTGPGAALYGNGPFQVSLSCFRDVNGTNVPVSIPGGADRVMSPSTVMSTVYDGLPVGANCRLVESRIAGANSVTWLLTQVVLPEDDVAYSKVSNFFDLGSMQVTKTVSGPLARMHQTDVFELSLACSRDVDGVTTPVDIPDGASREVTPGATAAYDDLPAGGDCKLQETVDGGATSKMLLSGLVPTSMNLTIPGGVNAYGLVNLYLPDLASTGSTPLVILLVAACLVGVGSLTVVAMRIRRRRKS